MSDDKDTVVPKKKGKGRMKMLLLGLLAVSAGGGTVFGLMAAGVINTDAAEAHEAGPQLVMKGDDDPYLPGEVSEEQGDIVYGEGGNKYRTAYYTFDEEFTSNLKDTDVLVQISLAASTQRDGRVLMWLDQHELAIRSQILIALADTPEEEIYSVEGKERLQRRLTQAVNDVLEEQEGFGGVDNVYFRTLIVQ